MIKTFRFENDTEFSSNSYVVSDENDNCVIIDIGSTNDKVLNYIKNNQFKCLAILLTHGHWDHIRGVNKILSSFKDCKVFINSDDDVMLSNSRFNCSVVLDKKSETIDKNINYFYGDGEIKFSDSLKFEIICTPFHTLGSSCFLYKKENALFTGDTLFKGSIGRTDLPHNCKNKQNESLSKLKSLCPDLNVFPGHGDETVLKKEFVNNIYLR